MQRDEFFKISSGIKSIVGKELITDQNVAVFELVKNSVDANATEIFINFIYCDDDICGIEICDNGEGMSEDDLLNKWLFLAYSHKKEENKNKRYLGAKGIGRFSCDRLGRNVEIFTKKQGQKTGNVLRIDWSKFEGVDEIEFGRIPVQLEATDSEDVLAGTRVKITSLRDKWDREALLRLKRSLTKLVSPDEMYKDIVNIAIDAEKEKTKDEKQQRDRDIVNGPVRNDLYEVLRIKSVSMQSEISHDGKSMIFQLIDKGQPVFKITVANTDYDALQNIKMDIFYASTSVKLSFNKVMGMASAHYGNIFVFKNGFRVLPYGEPDNDFFEMNLRKQQGTQRYFGTRDLLGRIEIIGNATGFIEASSRDNGFIQTRQVEQLKKYFISMMKILESYVTKVIDWGGKSGENDTEFNPSRINLTNLVKQLTGFERNDGVTIEHDEKLIKNLAQDAVKNSDVYALDQIKKIAGVNTELSKFTEVVETKIKSLRDEQDKSQKRIMEESSKTRQIQIQLDDTKRQNFFLQNAVDSDIEKLRQIIHLNMIFASKIDDTVVAVFESLKKENNNDLMEKVAAIQLWASRIYSLSNMGAKTNFSLGSDKQIDTDIACFIEDYIKSCYKMNSKIKVHVKNLADKVAVTFFASEVLALIENLISNAKKALAENIFFSLATDGKKLIIDVMDDGKGLHPDIANREDIFSLGFSKTGGSGIGLFQIKNIVEKMKGNVYLLPETEFSFSLRMEIKNGYLL